MAYIVLILAITFCAVYSQSCADAQSYCFRGLTLGHTWDQYSTQYIYEGDLNNCAYFKSLCNLYIYWTSQYNVWAMTNNILDGSALAVCYETKLDNCLNSQWYLSGSDGFAIDHNLKVEACDYDNILCSSNYNTGDIHHCIANTDHRLANSALSGIYLFQSCSMNEPHFSYTLSPGTQVTLTWNDVLSAWFLKTVPDSASWQTLAYCQQPELVNCDKNWYIHDGSEYTLDPLVISGHCDSCVVNYEICLDIFDDEYTPYGGKFSSDECDANGYPIFDQYENMDGDISSLSKISFDAVNASFFITDINGDDVYASCHSVSWKTCDGLWSPNDTNFKLSQCTTVAPLLTTLLPTTSIKPYTITSTTIVQTIGSPSSFVYRETTPIPSLHELRPKEENRDNYRSILFYIIVAFCMILLLLAVIFYLTRKGQQKMIMKRNNTVGYSNDFEPGMVAPDTVIVDANDDIETNIMMEIVDTNDGSGMQSISKTEDLNKFTLPITPPERVAIRFESYSASHNSMYDSAEAHNGEQHVAVMHPMNYEQWSLQQVGIWLNSLENGRYKKYVQRLIEAFTMNEVTAADLPSLPQGELANFGVIIYRDRKGLTKQFQRLRRVTIGEGGGNKEGHETSTYTGGAAGTAQYIE